ERNRHGNRNERTGGSHAEGDNAHPAGRRRDAPGRPARNARRTAQAPGRAALSLPFLRAQPGVLPRREGDVGRPPTRDEARARYAEGAAEPPRRLVERLRVLTGRECCRGQQEWHLDGEDRSARRLRKELALQ